MNTQPPVPGSRRHTLAVLVGQWLRRNTGPRHRTRWTYSGISYRLGLSIQQVQHAVYDLRDHFPDESFIISVPCAANGYTVEVGWLLAAKQGMANQLRQAATREISVATVLDRQASIESDENLAFVYRTQARHARQEALEKQELALRLLDSAT